MRRCLQGAAHQRCRVHFARNLLALIPKSHKDMVAAVFRTIFAQPDRAAVFAGWRDMNDYMRENKIEPVAPQLAAQARTAAAEAR